MFPFVFYCVKANFFILNALETRNMSGEAPLPKRLALGVPIAYQVTSRT